MMKTYAAKQSEIRRAWHLFDAEGQILGRLATQITPLLIGKQKPNYSAYLDMGDHVVVINASGIRLTGRKETQKIYDFYSPRPGHSKKKTYAELKAARPNEILRRAVGRMLPRNRLRDGRLARFHIYQGSEHPYGEKLATERCPEGSSLPSGGSP